MLYVKERAREEGLPEKTVLKEALQVSALEHLYLLPESNSVTFQGGTCLRLLYGGPRYSEDLDFVVSDFAELQDIFKKVASSMEKTGSLFEGNIQMSVQKESEELVRWKLSFESLEGNENASMNLEFAKYPAYTSELLVLRVPKGYLSIPMVLVKAESEEEILADKINAIASRKYLKGRDIFDVWLLKSKGVQVDIEMVEKKFRDYSSPRVKIEQRVLQFDEERIRQDLENFLPRKYREKFQKEGYLNLLKTAADLARDVDEQLK